MGWFGRNSYRGRSALKTISVYLQGDLYRAKGDYSEIDSIVLTLKSSEVYTIRGKDYYIPNTEFIYDKNQALWSGAFYTNDVSMDYFGEHFEKTGLAKNLPTCKSLIIREAANWELKASNKIQSLRPIFVKRVSDFVRHGQVKVVIKTNRHMFKA